MKPRTLARYALEWIEDGSFIFDNEERKTEAVKQMKRLVNGKASEDNNPEDPIIEIHIGVYIPSFDYPVVPINEWGQPFVWKEDRKYIVPGRGSHMVKGVGLNGNEYYLSYLASLAPYRNAVIKIDRYTDIKRAAYALVCCVSQILNKRELSLELVEHPLKLEWEVLQSEYKKHADAVAYEKQQKALYIQWLGSWISVHGRNPDTHMKVLKNPKKEAASDINNTR